MRYLSLSVLVLGLTFVSFATMADCPGHGVAQDTQKPATTVATADQASPQSTKVEEPEPDTGG